MIETISRPTATIHQFPPRGRFARDEHRAFGLRGIEVSTLPSSSAVPVSGGYHEAAIREDAERRGLRWL